MVFCCRSTGEKVWIVNAGHYTLSHMGYFWCQGCTDYSQSAEWYVTPDPLASDANGDGQINGKDLILLRQFLAGWNVTLGPQNQ